MAVVPTNPSSHVLCAYVLALITFNCAVKNKTMAAENKMGM